MNQIFAGFWRRGAALIVDSLLLALPGFAINLALASHPSVALVLNIAVGLAYFAGLHSSAMQATVGKRAFGIKVTDLEGKRIGIGLAVARYFAAWLSAIPLGLGYLAAAFTPKRQALHDLICKTLVVDRHTEPEGIAEGNDVMEVTWPVWAVVILLGVLPFVGGLVAAIAIPVYHDRMVRAEIGEVMADAEAIKSEIAEATVTRQPLRTGPRPGKSALVQTVNVDPSGQITIVFARRPLAGGKVFMAPLARRGSAFEWRCWAEGIPLKYMPAICREQ